MTERRASIALVDGAQLSAGQAAGVRELWERHGDGRPRELADVAALVVGLEGEIAGAASAVAAEAPLVRRRVWLYDAVLAPTAAAAADDLLAAVFAEMARRFTGAAGEPIGVCLQIADRDEMARRPQMQWEEPPFLYVGYLHDGRQLRVGYFPDARIGPGLDDA